MSSKKTPNLNLHRWEPNDPFLHSEMNDNFTALDAIVSEKGGFSTGSYEGNAQQRVIPLARRPKAVFIFGTGTATYPDTYVSRQSFIVDGIDRSNGKITAGGFEVSHCKNGYNSVDPDINHSGVLYVYIAFY